MVKLFVFGFEKLRDFLAMPFRFGYVSAVDKGRQKSTVPDEFESSE